MRRRAATTRLTLQEQYLPKSAEHTELNYRTCVTSARQDAATTIRLISTVTIAFLVIGFGLRAIQIIPYWVSGPFVGILFVATLVLAYFRFLKELPSVAELFLALIVLVANVLFAFVNYAPTMRAAYGLIFGTALALTALFAHFVTMQACAFMAVNERIPLFAVRVWQKALSLWWSRESSKTAPEFTHYRLSFAFLGAAYLIGFGVMAKNEGQPGGYAATLGVLGFLASLYVFRLVVPDLGRAPRPEFLDTVKATWRALTTFVCYNRHHVQAAGLFRFPTRFLRPPLTRDLFLGITLAFLTTALVGASVSSPSVFIEEHWPTPVEKQAEAKPQPKPEPPQPKKEFKLTPVEEKFAQTLSAEMRAKYVEAKKREFEAAHTESPIETLKRSGAAAVKDVGLILVLCLLGPFALLFSVLWFTSGQLLNRFYYALEAPNAYELPPEPTEEDFKAGITGTTTWDNRVERMVWSSDELETEHFYLGSSMEGDFPVLLHRDLLYRHAHILGDTGSRKTSIGIAPVLTQLIARENCSVIVFDLKGDRALFNAAKDEARAAGVPFKWFTNIVGKSSFVFNPLAQSHLHRLTTDQLTQGILQALDLEHGQAYGRGHFSALNDVVLGGYLRKYRNQVGSFKELSSYVSDRNAYRNISQDDEDWRNTRQLANLVEKIAHVGPMNETAKTLKDRPGVLANQIDMASVLSERQVIYFYLSSSLDPRTVSPIAKLAMFALLGAAEFRQGVEPRCFVFIDEFQRVISEAMTLFFEQARSKGLHFLLANQTISQLDSKGIDITGVIESCTGFKQSFRASDAENVKRIVESSGEAVFHSYAWSNVVDDVYHDRTPHLLSLANTLRRRAEEMPTHVTEQVGPRMERNTVIDVSALPLSSFVKFDEGSGYTQYAGYWTTVLSEYHISKPLYNFYEREPIPAVDDRTVEVPGDPVTPDDNRIFNGPIPTNVPKEFDADIERRLNS